jgi:ABC-type polysaccharide/polyol phosphate transport system ATPase subunit
MTIISVAGVTKSFAIPEVHRHTIREHALALFRPRRFQQLIVLDGVSFDVERGETVGIMGRNGSGKSTLLKILAGIYRPDAGTVKLDAPVTPILELGLGFNPELDAVDNVYLVGSVMGLSLARIRAAMDDILAFAELERFARLKLQHFSSGMTARLAYAVAFHAVQDVLILDEIFAVGDARFRSRCEERYRELAAAGHSVLVVSHEARVIKTFCHRALLLEGGRIIADGDPDKIIETYLSVLQSPP